jgi:hypothetical protein
VETLFYPAVLHSSSRIFIQTRYILWKHPMHWGGVKPHSPTPIRKSIQDPESELPRILIPRTQVNRGYSGSYEMLGIALASRFQEFLEVRQSNPHDPLRGEEHDPVGKQPEETARLCFACES